jgi:putative tricarboxylic transport membrane protein
MLISIGTFLATKDLEYLGKVYPISVSIIMFLMSAIIAVQMFLSNEYSSVLFDNEQSLSKQKDLRPFWLPIYWFISPLVLSIFIGFYISIGLFVTIFLIKIAKVSLRKSIIGGIGVWIVLALISHFMIMDFPPGIIQSFIELPWPIN